MSNSWWDSNPCREHADSCRALLPWLRATTNSRRQTSWWSRWQTSLSFLPGCRHSYWRFRELHRCSWHWWFPKICRGSWHCVLCGAYLDTRCISLPLPCANSSSILLPPCLVSAPPPCFLFPWRWCDPRCALSGFRLLPFRFVAWLCV